MNRYVGFTHAHTYIGRGYGAGVVSAMAESLSSGPQALEKIKKEISCAMCLELYEEPKTLPSCLHTFCKACLVKSEAARRRFRQDEADQPVDTIECPECRRVSKVAGGVEEITTNFMYTNIIQHLKNGDGEGTDGRSLQSRASGAPIPPCQKHSDEKLKLFCLKCNVVVCRDCILKDHKDHPYDLINDMADSEREKLRRLVLPLQEDLQRLTVARDAVRDVRRGLEKVGDERLAEISAAFDRCLERVEERRRHFLEHSRGATEVKLKAVDHHGDQLDSVHSQITDAIEFTSNVFENASNFEVFMYRGDILSRVDNLKQLCKEAPLQVDEEDRAAFVIETECLKELGAIVEVPCPETSFVEGPKLLKPVQKEQCTVTAVAHNHRGHVLVHGGGVCTAQLSCIPYMTGQRFSQEATVTDNKDGTYTVEFTPSYPGQAFLGVFFDGQPLNGTPIELDVVRNYANVFLEPFAFEVRNASPWGVAMVNDGEIAVTSSDNVIRIYTTRGREVETIRSNFTKPYGIWSDGNGTIWITDREAHNVQKFSREGTYGKFKKIFQFGHKGVNPGQFSHPRGVALHSSSSSVYISDMKNHRIQIFSQTLSVPKYQGQFGGPGSGPGLFNLPAGICFDRQDHLLVCDDRNNRLQVFDAEGRFLHTLGMSSTQRGLLCSPIWVSCDTHGRYIITEFGSHIITFMSPEGEILSSVRSLGPKYGQFVHPRGVACDSVGYVYVADHENSRIARF